MVAPVPDGSVGVSRATVNRGGFNRDAALPYELRLVDFEAAIQDVYDLLHDVNTALTSRGLRRLEETVRPATISGPRMGATSCRQSLTRLAGVWTSGRPVAQPVRAGSHFRRGGEPGRLWFDQHGAPGAGPPRAGPPPESGSGRNDTRVRGE